MAVKVGDDMQKCENTLCIYQENGVCALDTITLDEGGRCLCCIIPHFDTAILQSAKVKTLQTLATQ